MLLSQSAQDYVDDMERLPGGTAVSQASTPTGVTPVAPTVATPGLVQTIASLIPAGVSAYQQIQLQNLQMNLLKQGRPLLTTAQLSQLAPQFRVGLASDTQNLVVYGGAALLGLMLLSQLGKRRRA